MSPKAHVTNRTAEKLIRLGIGLAADARRFYPEHREAAIAVAEAARCLGTAAREIKIKLGVPLDEAPDSTPEGEKG